MKSARPLLASAVAVALCALVAAGCSEDSHDTGGVFDPNNSGAAFDSLGRLAGGDAYAYANAISNDGITVVGTSQAAPGHGFEGFVSYGGGPLVPTLAPSGEHVGSDARAVSADGSVVAGNFTSSTLTDTAGRWTRRDGWHSLPLLAGGQLGTYAAGISADGRVVVGRSDSDLGDQAVRWVNGEAFPLGDLDGGLFASFATAVSSDGQTIAGSGYSASGSEAFVWTASTGMTGLGDLPGGAIRSEAYGMNADGSVIVGLAASADGLEAFRWTAQGGMTGLGNFEGGGFSSQAFGVSADGSIVVGSAEIEAGPEAFVWDAQHGMRSVRSVLLHAGITSVSTWRLTDATGISSDGRIVVGSGVGPRDVAEAWVARLPK